METRATTLIDICGVVGLGGVGILFWLPLDLCALSMGLALELVIDLAVFGFEDGCSLVTDKGGPSPATYCVP